MALDDEVGRDAIHGRVSCFVPSVAWLGVEAGDVVEDGLERRFVDLECALDLLEILVGEGVEMVVDDAEGEVGVGCGGFLLEL